MLVFLICWFIIIFGFTVLGFTADRLFQKLAGSIDTSSKSAPDLWFFAGLILTTLYSGWLSIILPINDYIRIGYPILILALAIFQFRSLAKAMRFWWNEWRKLNTPFWLVALYGVAVVMLASYMSARGIQVYDAGLYHIQNIEWIQQYSVVPGLGNLHSRFALNSMVFPLQAIFEFTANGQLAYPLWGAVLIVVAGRLLFEIDRAGYDKQWGRAVFYSFLASIIIAMHSNHFGSPSTDVIGNLCVVYLAAFIVVHPRDYLAKGFESWVLVALLLLLPTFKLSNSMMIVFLVPLLQQFNVQKILAISTLIILIISPFIIRNYFLSGYLLFPLASVDIFSPDWKIPKHTVEMTREVILSWAILPRVDAQVVQEMSIIKWMPQWFGSYSIIHRFLLLLNLISALIWLIAVLLRKQRALLLVHAATLLNVLFWFFSAPDMRLALGLLVFNAGLAFLYLRNLKVYSAISLKFKHILVILPLLSWTYLNRFELVESISDSRYLLTPISGFSPPELHKNNDPFIHYQPVDDDRCYDATLPCTPEKCDHLEMRGQTLGDGYRVVSQ